MKRIDSWKFLLFLLSFSFFVSCSICKKNSCYNEDRKYYLGNKCESLQSYSIDVPINKIKQRQRNDCWFAAYCVLKSWKDKKNYSYREVKATLGNWKEQIQRNMGLFIREQEPFCADFNLGFYAPASYIFEEYVDMLQRHGPLIVCMGKVGMNHARVLHRIDCGDNPYNTFFYLFDPRKGRTEKWNYFKFLSAFECEAKEVINAHQKNNKKEGKSDTRMSDPWRYQILYIK